MGITYFFQIIQQVKEKFIYACHAIASFMVINNELNIIFCIIKYHLLQIFIMLVKWITIEMNKL